MGRASRVWHRRRRKDGADGTNISMSQPCDLNRSRTALEQDCTLIAVIEMSLNSWLIAGIVPGIERHPLKKLAVDEHALLKLLRRWQAEAVKAGHTVKRVAVAFEAGRDGFWLARWLRARDVEAYVIHASSVAVSREHRRAKTDRLDTELLKRAFIGWLRGEPHHCHMAAIPTIEQEDAKRANRERENSSLRAIPHHQSDEGLPYPVRGASVQADFAQGTRSPCQIANTGGSAFATQYHRRNASRHGTVAVRPGSDQGD